jgi:MoxR-like ATPase
MTEAMPAFPSFPTPPTTSAPSAPPSNSQMEDLRRKTDRVLNELRKIILGQDEVLEHLLVALLCEGHVLLEGVPGTGKTLMVKMLSRCLDLRFNRVQFTPDLMPSDVLGTNIFDLQKNEFRLARGPVFTDILLADEINRAPAKTQSALLECMEERQVTIDGVRHSIGEFFTCFATQNPVEYEGTYPLPEAQLDRFLLKVIVDYPSADEEDMILQAVDKGFDARRLEQAGVTRVATKEDLMGLKARVRTIRVDEPIRKYIRDVVRSTRSSPSLLMGGGPRASIHLLVASKAMAALRARDFVTPDDVKSMAYPVMRHRIILRPDAELEGMTHDQVIRKVIDGVKVPR